MHILMFSDFCGCARARSTYDRANLICERRMMRLLNPSIFSARWEVSEACMMVRISDRGDVL